MARRKSDPGKMERTRTPGVYKRNGAYVVRIYNPDTKKRENYPAATYDRAREIKANAEKGKRLQRRNGRAAITVREWAGDPQHGVESRWLKLCPRPSESTMAHNTERVRQFVTDHGDLLLSAVTPEMAAEWAIDNPGRVRVVKAMFNDAVKLRLIDESPFAHVDGPERRTRDIVVVTDEEITALGLVAARKWGDYGRLVLAPMIEFAAWSGLRPGELYDLDGDSIDRRAGVILVRGQWNTRLGKRTDTKNHQAREVVLLPRAERALEQLPRVEAGVPLFPAKRGQRLTARTHGYYWRPVRDMWVDRLPDTHHLRRRLARSVDDAMDFYELRHRFGTELAHQGCSQFEIADQMGHTDNGAIALRHYVKTDKARLAESVRARFRDVA